MRKIKDARALVKMDRLSVFIKKKTLSLNFLHTLVVERLFYQNDK